MGNSHKTTGSSFNISNINKMIDQAVLPEALKPDFKGDVSKSINQISSVELKKLIDRYQDFATLKSPLERLFDVKKKLLTLDLQRELGGTVDKATEDFLKDYQQVVMEELKIRCSEQNISLEKEILPSIEKITESSKGEILNIFERYAKENQLRKGLCEKLSEWAKLSFCSYRKLEEFGLSCLYVPTVRVGSFFSELLFNRKSFSDAWSTSLYKSADALLEIRNHYLKNYKSSYWGNDKSLDKDVNFWHALLKVIPVSATSELIFGVFGLVDIVFKEELGKASLYCWNEAMETINCKELVVEDRVEFIRWWGHGVEALEIILASKFIVSGVGAVGMSSAEKSVIMKKYLGTSSLTSFLSAVAQEWMDKESDDNYFRVIENTFSNMGTSALFPITAVLTKYISIGNFSSKNDFVFNRVKWSNAARSVTGSAVNFVDDYGDLQDGFNSVVDKGLGFADEQKGALLQLGIAGFAILPGKRHQHHHGILGSEIASALTSSDLVFPKRENKIWDKSPPNLNQNFPNTPAFMRPEDRNQWDNYQQRLIDLGLELIDDNGHIRIRHDAQPLKLNYNLIVMTHGNTLANNTKIPFGKKSDCLPEYTLADEGEEDARRGNEQMLRMVDEGIIDPQKLIVMRPPYPRHLQTERIVMNGINFYDPQATIITPDLYISFFGYDWGPFSFEELGPIIGDFELSWVKKWRELNAFVRFREDGSTLIDCLSTVKTHLEKWNTEHSGKTIVFITSGSVAAVIRILTHTDHRYSPEGFLSWRDKDAKPPRGEPTLFESWEVEGPRRIKRETEAKVILEELIHDNKYSGEKEIISELLNTKDPVNSLVRILSEKKPISEQCRWLLVSILNRLINIDTKYNEHRILFNLIGDAKQHNIAIVGGRYVYKEVLSSGFFGYVFRVWDNKENRMVALKLANGDYSKQAEKAIELLKGRDRIVQHHEVQKIDHRVFGFVVMCTTMELVDSTDFIHTRKDTPETKIKKYTLSQIIEAYVNVIEEVQFLNKNQIYPCDLQFFISMSGKQIQIKLFNLDLWKFSEPTIPAELTKEQNKEILEYHWSILQQAILLHGQDSKQLTSEEVETLRSLLLRLELLNVNRPSSDFAYDFSYMIESLKSFCSSALDPSTPS